MWMIFARRVLFVSALLFTGAASTIYFHYTVHDRASESKALLAAMGYFAWGADFPHLLLALWLAGRKGVWNNWRGWLRAVLYIAAFIYGRLLFTAVAEWFYQANIEDGVIHFRENAKPFQWPGAIYEHYARPMIDILEVLIQTWILLPVFVIARRWLAEHEKSWRSSFTIGTIIIWTGLTALIVSWAKLLTWEEVAPPTYFSDLTTEVLLRMYAYQYAPSMAISALVAWCIAWGWSGNRWLTMLVLLLALPLDVFAHQASIAVVRWLGKNPGTGVITGTAIEQWSYLAGHVAMAWCAFGVARALGVQLRKGSPRVDFENTPPKPT